MANLARFRGEELFSPLQKKNRVPHKRSERAGREKREEEIDQEREIEREIEITRARDAAKGRSILTYK